MKPATRLAAGLLTLIAVGHILRLLFRVDVVVGGVEIPLWASVVAVIVAGGLAVALWREQG